MLVGPLGELCGTAEHRHRGASEVPGAVHGREHERTAALGHEAQVEAVQWGGDHGRRQDVLDGVGAPAVHDRLAVDEAVVADRGCHRGDLFLGGAVVDHVALRHERHLRCDVRGPRRRELVAVGAHDAGRELRLAAGAAAHHDDVAEAARDGGGRPHDTDGAGGVVQPEADERQRVAEHRGPAGHVALDATRARPVEGGAVDVGRAEPGVVEGAGDGFEADVERRAVGQ